MNIKEDIWKLNGFILLYTQIRAKNVLYIQQFTYHIKMVEFSINLTKVT